MAPDRVPFHDSGSAVDSGVLRICPFVVLSLTNVHARR